MKKSTEDLLNTTSMPSVPVNDYSSDMVMARWLSDDR